MRWTIVALMVVVAGCGGESSPTGTDGMVAFSNVHKTKTSGIAARRAEVISRADRWAEVWSDITSTQSPRPALPAVNFEESILIFAAGGELADSCSDIRVESVTRVSGALQTVILEERRPSCTCPPVVIRPVHVVAVPRAATGASFEFRIATLTNCS
jgi:hypothetical protein